MVTFLVTRVIHHEMMSGQLISSLNSTSTCSLSLCLSGFTGNSSVNPSSDSNFDNAPPVCISIETRPEEGEDYSPIASLFKQYELIYVVGEERDLVRVRTNYRQEEVYLYRIQTTPEAARRLFLVYLGRIDEPADRPEWYLPAEEQLHAQHRTLCERSRPGRQPGYPPLPPQRLGRSIPVRDRRGGHVIALPRASSAFVDQRGRTGCG